MTLKKSSKIVLKEDHGLYEQWYMKIPISRGFELGSPSSAWTSGTPIGLILTPRPKNFLDQKTRENRVWNFQIALAGALLKLSKWNFDSRRVWVSSWYRISRKKWFETFHFSDFFKKPAVGGRKMGYFLNRAKFSQIRHAICQTRGIRGC